MAAKHRRPTSKGARLATATFAAVTVGAVAVGAVVLVNQFGTGSSTASAAAAATNAAGQNGGHPAALSATTSTTAGAATSKPPAAVPLHVVSAAPDNTARRWAQRFTWEASAAAHLALYRRAAGRIAA